MFPFHLRPSVSIQGNQLIFNMLKASRSEVALNPRGRPLLGGERNIRHRTRNSEPRYSCCQSQSAGRRVDAPEAGALPRTAHTQQPNVQHPASPFERRASSLFKNVLVAA